MSLKNSKSFKSSLNKYYEELKELTYINNIEDIPGRIRESIQVLRDLMLPIYYLLKLFFLILFLLVMMSYCKFNNKCFITLLIFIVIISLLNSILLVAVAILNCYRELIYEMQCARNLFISNFFEKEQTICNNDSSNYNWYYLKLNCH